MSQRKKSKKKETMSDAVKKKETMSDAVIKLLNASSDHEAEVAQTSINTASAAGSGG